MLPHKLLDRTYGQLVATVTETHQPLLEGICVFTPGVAEAFDALHDRPLPGLVAYLSDGLSFAVSEQDVCKWSKWQDEAASTLASALREPPRPYSSSERVLLALPMMEPRPTSSDDVDHVVKRYVTAIRHLQEADDQPLLDALADYGRRWEVIVETVVPLGEPSTVTLLEDRPLGLQRDGSCTQRVVMGDARSFHLEARVTDHTVEIADFQVHDLDGEILGVPRLEAARQTSESLALYSSQPDRPFHADVTLWLRPVTEVRATAWLVLGLAWLAVLGAWLVPGGQDLVGALGVLTLPTTFAVALVLIRDQSSLAARLQRRTRFVLSAAIGVLWVVALVRLLV